MRSRHAKAAATTQTVATARASERRNSPCRVPSTTPHEVRRRQGPGGGVRDAVHGEVPEALLLHEPGTQHFSLDDDDSVPELGLQRRTVEQIVDCVPVVPLLHDVEPQMEDQLVEVLRPCDTMVPEQVIEAPKITSQDVIPPRAVLRVPQMAEQLVEVPTVPCLPQGMTILARFSDAAGHSWSQIAGPTEVFWWRSGTLHVQWTPPDLYTARPGRYTNTGRRGDSGG